MIEFFVRMDPVAQGRPKFSTAGGFTRAYDPKKSRDAKQYIRMAAAEAMRGKEPFTGALEVQITAFRQPPKSASQKKVKDMLSGLCHPVTKPDTSNYQKLAEDALNGVVWRDDSQIVDSLTRKRYGMTPGYKITVRQRKPENKESGE